MNIEQIIKMMSDMRDNKITAISDAMVLLALCTGPKSIQQLVVDTGLQYNTIQTVVGRLLLNGSIKRRPFRKFHIYEIRDGGMELVKPCFAA